ncbi:transglycosylase SLT domain protein [mine drainage metagenome]|uniref:Transglycosylase SLT domain protein n=1 Tax=mine drainage metagenome TaxID=410659 RepID=A0A1J5RHS2_9ZZZZ
MSIWALIAAGLGGLCLTPGAGAAAPPSCLPVIQRQEQALAIPAGLLRAIALAESGRPDPAGGTLIPWPWTINVQGRGRYLDSRQSAVRETAQLLAGADGFIDVGCMQIDLYHHPHAFQTLDEAFAPDSNVRYAAAYLHSLYQQRHSWLAAIAVYHAGNDTGTEAATYLAHVLYLWKQAPSAAADDDAAGLPPAARIAVGFLRAGDDASALAIYTAMLNTTPDDRLALLGAAAALRHLRAPEAAGRYYLRALSADPGDQAAIDGLLELIDAAPAATQRRWLEQAAAAAPGVAVFANRLARRLSRDGETETAASLAARAARLAPGIPAYLLDDAELQDRAGHTAAAIREYDAFLQAYHPENTTIGTSIDSIRARLRYLRSRSL